MKVFLDTCVLPHHRYSLWSGELGRLIELSQSDMISIVMSEVVVGEWKSQFIENILQDVKTFRKASRELLKYELTDIPEYFYSLQDILNLDDKLISDASSMAETTVQNAISKLKVEIVPISDTDASEVFSDYFKGQPPFKERKSRKDLPDAFIAKAAIKLAHSLSAGETIHVCTNDDGMAKCFTNLPQFAVHKNLRDLLNCSDIKSLIESSPIGQLWIPEKIEKAVRYLYIPENRCLFEERFKDRFIEELYGIDVTDSSIPSDHHEAAIESVDSIDELQIDWRSHQSELPGTLEFPFRLRCRTYLLFFIHRSNAWNAPDWVTALIQDATAPEIFCQAVGWRGAMVRGIMKVTFSNQYMLQPNHDDLPGIEFDLDQLKIDLDPIE